MPRGHRVTEETKKAIRKLLEVERLSLRNIAEMAGVGRETVRKEKRESCPKRLPVKYAKRMTNGIGIRCKECGALVYGGCRECRLKEEKKNGSIVQTYFQKGDKEALDLDLAEDEITRLEEIKEQKIKVGELSEEELQEEEKGDVYRPEGSN